MISIIIPVYNTELYLEKCIQSVISQSYKNWECILINDGSKDSSGSICDKWKEKDNRIRVIHQENQGVSTTRNRGINESKGEFITFVDSDDWLENKYLEDLYNEIKSNNTDLVVSGIIRNTLSQTEHIIASTKGIFKISPQYIDEFNDLNIKYLLFPPYAKLYKKEIIEYNNIRYNKDFSYGEDLLFNYTYLNHVKNYSVIKKANYHYRILGNNSLSSQIRINQFDIDYYQWKLLYNFYFNHKLCNESSKVYLYNRLWGIIYDGIFLCPKFKKISHKYINNILSTKEILSLFRYYNSYHCSTWIKLCILFRFSSVFYIYFKLTNK